MPHQLGHLNYNPEQAGENVDKWHADTLRIDFVLFVTDPNAIEGGEFEFFRGTTDEVRKLKADGQPLPADRVVAAPIPGPGYAVLQQGNMVVHRAKALSAPGERITLVNGYVPADMRFPISPASISFISPTPRPSPPANTPAISHGWAARR